MSEKSPWIVETSPETFHKDVIQRSSELPVVLDFWAAWCGPCRMLGPILERLAVEANGKFLLVKADTERMPEIAAELGVQAIPAVFGLRNGQIVDQFVGLLPEAQIKAWIQRLLPGEAETLAEEARGLEDSDPARAEALYRRAAELQPSGIAARIGLARVLLDQGKIEEAGRILDGLADAGMLDAEGERLRATVMLARQSQAAGTLEECRARAAAAPDDLDAQMNLVRALAGAGFYQEAMDVALALIGRDRQRMGEPARELMVQIFHLLGPESELAGDYRRKLAMALF